MKASSYVPTIMSLIDVLDGSRDGTSLYHIVSEELMWSSLCTHYQPADRGDGKSPWMSFKGTTGTGIWAEFRVDCVSSRPAGIRMPLRPRLKLSMPETTKLVTVVRCEATHALGGATASLSVHRCDEDDQLTYGFPVLGYPHPLVRQGDMSRRVHEFLHRGLVHAGGHSLLGAADGQMFLSLMYLGLSVDYTQGILRRGPESIPVLEKLFMTAVKQSGAAEIPV